MRPAWSRPLALVLALCLPGTGVWAQAQTPPPPLGQGEAALPQGLQLLTVETERMLQDSAFGQRVSAEIEADGQALAAENRRIEQELTEEERALTEARASMAADDFRARAEAFDTKVEELRQTQDAKAREITTRTDDTRRQFLRAARPILADLLRETGALVILERRAALISVDAVDVTDLAIRRIDAAIGDGSDLPALPGED